jgi:hypothetical protein
MPELPDATRARLGALGLAERDVGVLMSVDAGREVGFDGALGAGAVAYFDAVARRRDPKLVANWSVGLPCLWGSGSENAVAGSRTSSSASWRCGS